MSKLPNFFLVGAAKAGTTSLHAYLDQHPQVFVSPIKEPCYFAGEVRPEHLDEVLLRGFARNQREMRAYLNRRTRQEKPQGMVLDWDTYGRLWTGVKNETAIGEASVIYLWSPTAAGNIATRIPEARILMILRDPAERAYSQYLDYRTAGVIRHPFREHIRNALQYRGGRVGMYHPFLEFGCYAGQIRRYLEVFPRNRIHIVLYDDYQSAPGDTMKQVLRFLQVDPAIPIDMSQRHNQPRVPRFGAAGCFLKKTGVWQRARRLVPDRLARLLRPLAVAPRESLLMDPNDRAYLVAHYREEIRDLQDLLGRDLSAWLR